MDNQTIYQSLVFPLVVSLIGFLIVGAGAFIIMSITKVSKKDFEDSQSKQDDLIDRKFMVIEERIVKARDESERLFSKELEIVRTQLDFLVSGITDLKERIKNDKH